MIEIEICERAGDWCLVPEFRNSKFIGMKEAPKYHAQIKGEPGYWSAGRSIDEAIGDLIKTHPERFKVTIRMLQGKQPR